MLRNAPPLNNTHIVIQSSLLFDHDQIQQYRFAVPKDKALTVKFFDNNNVENDKWALCACFL